MAPIIAIPSSNSKSPKYTPSRTAVQDKPKPKKRIIICCDGTWQSSAHGTNADLSNITKISRSFEKWYKDSEWNWAPQIV